MNDWILVFRVHALQRMFEREITRRDVRDVVNTGKPIEVYLDDQPYPSRLMIDWCGNRPLHVVVAENRTDQAMIVITAYEPDLERWEPGFERRRTS